MNSWYRVFGETDAQPDVVALAGALQSVAPGSQVYVVQGGERGWQRLELRLADDEASLFVDRFWRDEEGIRAELQAWAAWLETCADHPYHEVLMQHMTSTRQVFTLQRSIDQESNPLLEQVCVTICQVLARATEGVYQIDGQGFFTADGMLLLREYKSAE
jgi:hypothetical protein